MESEQSEQRELTQKKENMTAAFSNRTIFVEEDADAEAEFVKVDTLKSTILQVIVFGEAPPGLNLLLVMAAQAGLARVRMENE